MKQVILTLFALCAVAFLCSATSLTIAALGDDLAYTWQVKQYERTNRLEIHERELTNRIAAHEQELTRRSATPAATKHSGWDRFLGAIIWIIVGAVLLWLADIALMWWRAR